MLMQHSMSNAEELVKAVEEASANSLQAIKDLYFYNLPLAISGIKELVYDYAPLCNCSCHKKQLTVGCDTNNCGFVDELSKCSTCERRLCDDCVTSCLICDQAAFCGTCIEEESCGVCEQAVCKAHMKECENCGEMRCPLGILCCCEDEDIGESHGKKQKLQM
jgi:hypothetical protein